MSWIDGNWVDICSLVVAMLYVLRKFSRRKGKFISKAAAIEIANACSLFPLFLLGMSILSSALLSELMHANKLILSVAGFSALLATLEDDF